MAKRGRKPGFRMSEHHRVKIQNSNILNALLEHVEGKREMSSTQCSVGLGLLRKVMPDLQSIEHSGDADKPIIQEIRQVVVETRHSDSEEVPAAAAAGEV